MKILGMTVGEISALLGVLGVLSGWLAFLLRKAYKVIKDDIVKPVRASMESLEKSIDGLAKNVDSETKWIHERHSEVVKVLNDHEDHLDRHDIEIAKHRERIRTLCEDRKKGYNK